VGRSDGLVDRLSVRSGVLFGLYEGHTDSVQDIAVTPDDKTFVSASADKTLRVWDIETGKTLHVLSGHVYAVNSVAITPDGKYVVSTDNGGILKIWDINTGKELRSIDTGQEKNVEGLVMKRASGLAITPDGKYVISSGVTGILDKWQITRDVYEPSEEVQLEASRELIRINYIYRDKEAFYDALERWINVLSNPVARKYYQENISRLVIWYDGKESETWGLSRDVFGKVMINPRLPGGTPSALRQGNDSAMNTPGSQGDGLNDDQPEKKAPGGINMDPSNLELQIKRDANGMPLPVNQQNLENIKIEGLVPLILNIKPVISTPLFEQLTKQSTD